MTRRLLWSTSWQPERTIAFAAIGTRHVIGLVGAHNLPGLTGATAEGSTWQVSHGILQVTPPDCTFTSDLPGLPSAPSRT
jgi:hypothetical protein